MKLTDRLYDAAKEIWDGYLEQPFVKELGEGTLREDRFRFYMVQDYRYLLQYAKVFAMGVVKAEDERMMCRFAHMVHDTLDGEMNLHKTYMSRSTYFVWGLRNRKLQKQNLPSPTSLIPPICWTRHIRAVRWKS